MSSSPMPSPSEGVEVGPQLQYLLATITLLSGAASLLFLLSVLCERLRCDNVALAATIAALSSAWYCVSMTLTLFNRLLLGYLTGFAWPVTMSLSHMTVKGLLALLGILMTASTRGVEDLPPFRRTLAVLVGAVKSQDISAPVFWTVLVPLGAATAIDVVLSALSLQFLDVSVYTVAKSTALIFTLAFSLCARLQQPTPAMLLAVCAVGAGVVMCSVRPAAVDARGLLCAVTAAACGAARWVLTEKFFARRGVPSHPLLLITLLSPITVMTLLPALAWEAPRMAASTLQSTPGYVMLVLAMMLGGGMLAFLLLLVELQLVRMTSALSLNVIGHFKDIVVIGLAIPIFHETLSPLNAAGVAFTVMGTTAYSVHKAKVHAEQQAAVAAQQRRRRRVPMGTSMAYTLQDDAEEEGERATMIDDDMEFAIISQQARDAAMRIGGVVGAGGDDEDGDISRLDLDFDDSDEERDGGGHLPLARKKGAGRPGPGGRGGGGVAPDNRYRDAEEEGGEREVGATAASSSGAVQTSGGKGREAAGVAMPEGTGTGTRTGTLRSTQGPTGTGRQGVSI